MWFIFRWCLETSSSCRHCYHCTGKTMVSAMQKLNFSTSERHLQQKCLLSHTMLTCTGSNTRNRSLDMVQCGLPSVPRALKYMRYVYAWGKMVGFIYSLSLFNDASSYQDQGLKIWKSGSQPNIFFTQSYGSFSGMLLQLESWVNK